MRTALLIALLLSPFMAPAGEVRLRRHQLVEPYATLQIPWGEKAYMYMDAADTWLSARRPDDNFGAARALRLTAGQRDAMLLQFGQLNRAIWRGATIRRVRLNLHPVAGRFPRGTEVAVYRVLREWRDGGADGAPMPWTATYRAAMSPSTAGPVLWAAPGARGAADRAARPSLVASTSEGYNPLTNTWTLEGPGLLGDVREWFGRWYRNWGWAIVVRHPESQRTDLEVYSGDSMVREVRPELIVDYEPLLTEGVKDGPDLNVTFISRTPRFKRYHDDGQTSYVRRRFRDDNPGIMKFPVNADTQKWPERGDMMTYTATIKNSGFDPYEGPAMATWTLNGRVLRRERITLDLAPAETVRRSIQIPWTGDLRDIRDEKLWFEIEPLLPVREITLNNNAQSKYIKARTWKYWVARSAYEYARRYMTAYGSYSFEDYLKWHEHIWNDTFLDRSRFDGLAPDGSLQRITLDDFEIMDDDRIQGFIHRLDDRPDFHFDGEWGTSWLRGADRTNPQAIANIQNFLRATRILLETSLLHEATHQVLGDFDQYWSNIEPSEPRNPIGKNRVRDGGEFYITRGSMFPFPGLMGGDDTRPNEGYTEGTGLFSAHSIIGFNANTPFRGGFFGEWQYSMPRQVSVRLLAAGGAPLGQAEVKIWQFSATQINDRNVVASGLRAGADGALPLPNQSSLEDADVTTLTGHTLLRENPFGRICVVGINTVLLLKIEAFGQVDWRFVRLKDLNKAFFRGYRDAYVLDVQTQITPAAMDFATNLARGRGVQTVLGQAEAGRLTDGDRESVWRGGFAPQGTFVQLDLGEPNAIGAVRFVQSANHGQFFQRFKVETSDDQAFRRGVTELTRQFPTSFSLAMTNERDIDPDRPHIRWVTYGSAPAVGRYLRITCLVDSGWTSLSEIEVFGPAAGP
jgi:hypothetical protein